MQRSGRTVCMVKTHKTARVQFRATQQFVKSGQIRDATRQAKNGTNWRPGRPLIFFRDLRLKIGTVPENPGRMVTLGGSVKTVEVRIMKFSMYSCPIPLVVVG